MHLKNPDEIPKPLRLVGKNALIYSAGIIGMRVSAFLLIPLYTHGLSIHEYGLLATLQLTMQVLLGFMNTGMRSCLLRFTEDCKKNNMFDSLLGTTSFLILFAGLIVSCLSFVFLPNLFRKILHVNNVFPYIYLTCGAALSQSLAIHLMTCYRAENRPFKYMLTGILSSLFLILVNVVFLCELNLGVNGALWAYIASYSVLLVFLTWDIFSEAGFGISWPLIPKLLHFGFPLIFSEFALLVIGGSSIYFLSFYLGLQSVAIFSLGSKFASVLSMAIISPFQLAFQPFVFSNLKRSDIKQVISRLMSYLFFAITLMFFIILFGSRIFLPIIAPPEYSSAFPVILFLLPGIAFIGIYYIGETLLGAIKKTYLTGFMMTVFALLAVVLNYLLIPQLNWKGAIIATNISYILAGVTFLMLGKKYFSFYIEWKKIITSGMFFTFFFGVFLILTREQLGTFVAVSVMIGAASIWLLLKLRFFADKELITILKGLF